MSYLNNSRPVSSQSDAHHRFVRTPSTSSDAYAEFDVAGSRAEAENSPHLFRLKMFCNISCFELMGIKPPSTTSTMFGGLSLIYAFYTRLYERLLKVAEFQTERKARASAGSFFSPFDPQVPSLGFLEFMMFCEDFKLTPYLLSKRQIQRIWLSLFDPSLHAFNLKVNLPSFERLLVILAEQCFNGFTLPRKTSRLASLLSLGKPREVKSRLFDVYRDKHFHSFSEFEPFPGVLKRMRIVVQPVGKLSGLKVELKDEKTCVQSISDFRWVKSDTIWEEYREASLDFGVLVQGRAYEYKIALTNAANVMLSVDVSVQGKTVGVDPLEIRWSGLKRLSPGNCIQLHVSVDTQAVAEWWGYVIITVQSAAGQVESKAIPAYCKVSCEENILPSRGMTPFPKVDMSRVFELARFDPTSTSNFASRRSGSRLMSSRSSRPPSAIRRTCRSEQTN